MPGWEEGGGDGEYPARSKRSGIELAIFIREVEKVDIPPENCRDTSKLSSSALETENVWVRGV